ncbi:MAG: amidohydrolase [Gammaproteobacteria bacterium]|nr:amidohydrolase [Gammaproteobacteria bacterium]
MDRYIVISSDCHAGLPGDRYRGYLDPQYREIFDQALPMQVAKIKAAEKSFLIQEINDQWRSGIEQQLTGAWDHAERIRMLDGDGIAGEVIFCDGITEMNTPPFGAGLSLPTEDIVPELQWAGARAHNRWLAELCAQAPARHCGVAVMPVLWDIEEAVREVRAVHEAGLRAVMIPNLTGHFPHYHHTRYNPFWEVCESLGMVVSFHSGAAPSKEYFGPGWPTEAASDYVGAMGIYVSEVLWWTYRPLTFLVWGGVFERYPKLRVSFTETGCGWMLPPYLRLLDHNYHDVQFSAKLGDFRSHLSLSPSDYFRRNVGIGQSCMPRSDADLRHEIGLEQLMWGSDYPHPEGSWPKTKPHLQKTFSGLPDYDIAQMLGENAIEFYRFDRAALVDIAARIGPKRSDFVATSS